MGWFGDALRQNPELAIFLTLAVGFFIGRLKIGSFSLGTVVGTLLAGVLVGQLGIQVPPLVKTVFFDLFLFTTGYKVGPQFFRGLKKDALSQVMLTVVLCVTCLLTAFLASKILGYDPGTAAGLLAGAFSESTVIGTAGDAINRLALSAEEKARLVNNIPIAYAVTYLVGTAGLVWFLPMIGPKLMGVDLRDESKKTQGEVAGAAEAEPGVVSAARRFDVRAYRVTNVDLMNRTVGAAGGAAEGPSGSSCSRVRRGGELIEAQPSTVMRAGDVIAVAAAAPAVRGARRQDRRRGRGPGLARRSDRVGGRGRDQPLGGGRPLGSSRAMSFARRRLSAKDRALWRGDADRLRHACRPGGRGDPDRHEARGGAGGQAASGIRTGRRHATDMVFVGTGIVLGGFVGLLSVTIAGLPITLTASGGALIMGLVFGWLRSAYPFFGRMPEPAIWIFDTVGLCVFIGVVGISAGPGFVTGLQKTGVSLVVVGLVCSLIPHTVAILFGRYVLRMNPLILLGACAGAGTITAALTRRPGRVRQQAPRPRVHRALRHRQHSPDGVGAGHRGADDDWTVG